MKTVMLSGLVVMGLALGLAIGCGGGGDSHGWDMLSYTERDEVCRDRFLDPGTPSPSLYDFIFQDVGLGSLEWHLYERYRVCMECGPLRVSCDTRGCNCE